MFILASSKIINLFSCWKSKRKAIEQVTLDLSKQLYSIENSNFDISDDLAHYCIREII